MVRHKLFTNENLLELWMNLFYAQCPADDVENDEDELYVSMIYELFHFGCELFLRISLIERLHKFKTELPRKKKQAIQTKITALTEKVAILEKKTKCHTQEEEIFKSSVLRAKNF